MQYLHSLPLIKCLIEEKWLYNRGMCDCFTWIVLVEISISLIYKNYYRTKGVATIMKMPMKDWKNILHVDVVTTVKVLPSCHGQWSDEPPIDCLACCSPFYLMLRGLFHIAP